MDAAAGISDHELMRRFGNGDEAAFEMLVRRWERPVANVVLRLSASNGDVADLCQEVFLRVLQARGRYRPVAAFSTWLYRVALNVARDYSRRRLRRRRTPQPAAPGETPGPGEVLDRQELAAKVQAALRALPRKLREPLVLRYFGELTFDEVARTIGSPVTTVKSRTYAAMNRLRLGLKKLGVVDEETRP